uniref:Ubiquitin-like protease family profile domain-containing protein n=1 Tax=Panagrolaimus davidi TaxID=227884 RepID=A0A914P6T5_9BILA
MTTSSNAIVTVDDNEKFLNNNILNNDGDNDNGDDPRLDEVANNVLHIPLQLYNLEKVEKKEYIDDVTIDSVVNKDVIEGHDDRLLVSATVWTQRIIKSWGPERRKPNRLPTVPRYSTTFKKAVIPIHMPGHWNCGVLDKETKKCTFYCTLRWALGEPYYSKLKLICRLLCGEECEILIAPGDSFLLQLDGYNCGPMICMLFYRILNNLSLFFGTAEANAWRQEVYDYYRPFVTDTDTSATGNGNGNANATNDGDDIEVVYDIGNVLKIENVKENRTEPKKGVKRAFQKNNIKAKVKKAKNGESFADEMEFVRKESDCEGAENDKKVEKSVDTMEVDTKNEEECEKLMTEKEESKAEKEKNETFDEFCKRKRIGKRVDNVKRK